MSIIISLSFEKLEVICLREVMLYIMDVAEFMTFRKGECFDKSSIS